MHVGSGADIDHSGLVFWSGGFEKCRQKQLREVERTCLQKALRMYVISLTMGIFFTKGVGPPGHVVPVKGNLVNRSPHEATVSEGRYIGM